MHIIDTHPTWSGTSKRYLCVWHRVRSILNWMWLLLLLQQSLKILRFKQLVYNLYQNETMMMLLLLLGVPIKMWVLGVKCRFDVTIFQSCWMELSIKTKTSYRFTLYQLLIMHIDIDANMVAHLFACHFYFPFHLHIQQIYIVKNSIPSIIHSAVFYPMHMHMHAFIHGRMGE